MEGCRKVTVCLSFLFISELAGCSQKDTGSASKVTPAIITDGTLQAEQITGDGEQTDSIIHESVDILYYENGYPYIHDILTNHTDNVNLLPDRTENYNGGWSLYDGEIMTDFPQVGNGEANQAVYSLLCLKEVVFENGSVWSNPEYHNFVQTYAGRQTDVAALQSYYPHTYHLKTDIRR